MYASLRGGIGGLFDGGDYPSRITSEESVFISSPQIKRSQRYLSSYLCKEVAALHSQSSRHTQKRAQTIVKKTIEAHLYSCKGFSFFEACKQYLIIFWVICIMEISQRPENTFNYKRHTRQHGRMRTGKSASF